MFRIAIRMIFDDLLKSMGTLIGVVFAVFLMCQQLSILMGILGRNTAFIDLNDVDIWIASPATESTEATSNVPEQRVRQAAGAEGVLWASPVIVTGSEVTKSNGVKELVRVVGVEPPLLAGLPNALLPGTDRNVITAPGRILMEVRDRKNFGNPEIGDRIEIGGQMAVIAGFTQGLQAFAAYQMFTNIQDARGYAKNFPADRVTFVAVKVVPGANPIAVRDTLRARVPDVVVVTKEELRGMNIGYFLRRTPVGFVFGIGTLIAAIIGTIIVTVTLFSSVVDRTREYGTLKALGATNQDLRKLLLTQAMIFAVGGYGVGMTGFFIFKVAVTNTPLALRTPPWVMGLIAVITVLLCMGASVLAIRRVTKLEPALVFRG